MPTLTASGSAMPSLPLHGRIVTLMSTIRIGRAKFWEVVATAIAAQATGNSVVLDVNIENSSMTQDFINSLAEEEGPAHEIPTGDVFDIDIQHYTVPGSLGCDSRGHHLPE